MGLKTHNDRLQAIGLFNKYKEGTKTNATASSSPIVGFSTAVNQGIVISELQAIQTNQGLALTELQAILAKPDTEILESIGIDTNILTPVNIGTPTYDSLGTGGGTAPVLTGVTTSEFIYEESNDNYEIVVPITAGFPTTGSVDIYIQYEQSLTNPGNDGGSFTLYDPTQTTVLDSALSTPFSNITSTSQTIQLSFNNTSGHTSLNLVLRSVPSTTGYPAIYKVTVLGSTPLGFSPTDLIRRRDRFENNIQVSTQYLDASDNVYTLIGLFLRDSNRSTEQKLSTILNSIDSKVSTETNQVTQIALAASTNTLIKNGEAAVIDFREMEGGTLPIFPFVINQLGFAFKNGNEAVSIIPATVNNMTELVALWNQHITGIKAVVVDSENFKIVSNTVNIGYKPVDSIFLHNGIPNRRIWRAVNFIPSVENEANASSTDKTVEQLRRSYVFEQYANWEYSKGNTKELTYYTGSSVGNPSGNTNNVETIKFISVGIIYLTQTLTYYINNNVLNIAAT